MLAIVVNDGNEILVNDALFDTLNPDTTPEIDTRDGNEMDDNAVKLKSISPPTVARLSAESVVNNGLLGAKKDPVTDVSAGSDIVSRTLFMSNVNEPPIVVNAGNEMIVSDGSLSIVMLAVTLCSELKSIEVNDASFVI